MGDTKYTEVQSTGKADIERLIVKHHLRGNSIIKILDLIHMHAYVLSVVYLVYTLTYNRSIIVRFNLYLLVNLLALHLSMKQL